MQMITYQQPDVDVLYCAACEGTSLDAGNLEAIIDAHRAEADTRSVPEYMKNSLKEASEILTHPQKLISEWKDLKAVLRLSAYRIFVENPKLKSILLGIQKSLPF
jgi:Zn-finger nucleic acid-binding protein